MYDSCEKVCEDNNLNVCFELRYLCTICFRIATISLCIMRKIRTTNQWTFTRTWLFHCFDLKRHLCLYALNIYIRASVNMCVYVCVDERALLGMHAMHEPQMYESVSMPMYVYIRCGFCAKFFLLRHRQEKAEQQNNKQPKLYMHASL